MTDHRDMKPKEFTTYADGVEKGIQLALEAAKSWLFVTNDDEQHIIGGYLATESSARAAFKRMAEERDQARKR